MDSIKVEGKIKKVGDIVGFKYDIEQSGPIKSITHRYGEIVVTVEARHGGYVAEAGCPCYVDFGVEELWDE